MRLPIVDLAIIALYLISITFFGLRFRKSQRSLRDYFLADRNIPWWAIALSIVGADTSTLTVIGTPGIAYGGNFGFLQLVFGYLLGRIVVSLLFIPHISAVRCSQPTSSSTVASENNCIVSLLASFSSRVPLLKVFACGPWQL